MEQHLAPARARRHPAVRRARRRRACTTYAAGPRPARRPSSTGCRRRRGLTTDPGPAPPLQRPSTGGCAAPRLGRRIELRAGRRRDWTSPPASSSSTCSPLVAGLWLVGRPPSRPLLRPDRGTARRLGARSPSSTGSGRSASSSSSTSSPSSPASSPTPPRPASRCARRSAWRRRSWRPRPVRNWPRSPTSWPLGRSIDDALGELAERLPSRELVVLVTTLVLVQPGGRHGRQLAAQPHRDPGGAQGDPPRGPHPCSPR